ncbi:MAG: hypothetical protein J6Y96_01765 [Mycoplasma sp.]|nr:hypothetical protein [Mycoplasma sp.]
MKNIIILNHNQKSYQSQSYFAINFGCCLASKKKKVLVFSTILSPKYFNEIKINTSINNKFKSIINFKLYQYQKNLDVLMFGTDTNQKLKINNIDEVLRLLKKQLKLLDEKYDYLIIDLKNQWLILDEYFIRSDEMFLINFLEFIKNTKFNVLDNINYFKTKYNLDITKYPFVISNYDGYNKECLYIYSTLKTQYKVKKLFYINESFDQLIKFIKYEPWSKNSIILDTLIEKEFKL